MKKVMKDIFLKLMINILNNDLKFYNDLLFLPERMKIEKVENFVANLHDRTEYVIHIRNLKQTLNHGLVLKKVHRVIKFNQNAWLNTDLRKKTKSDFEK